MEIEKLVKQINKTFVEPKRLVEAKVTENGGLLLRIGNKDMSLDSDGSFAGSGLQLIDLETIEVEVPKRQLKFK